MEIRDLQLWQTFLTVAQERNFSKAARALQTNAPAVTKRISTLERSLGTRLFNRTTRMVSLTQEGETLLPAVQVLMDQAREVEAKASDRPELSGTIRLTCFNWLAQRWLAPLLASFQELHPEVRLEVLVTDQMVDLVQEQVDLAIRVQEPKGADFVFRELSPNRLVICASPAYLKASAPLKRPADLMKHRLLALSAHEDLRFTTTGERLGDFSSRRAIVCESGPFLTDLALVGGGIAVRARLDADIFLREGKLVECLPKHPLESFHKIYLVIPQKRYLTNRVRKFCDFLVENRPKLA
jgi:LysR family transcriptional regulator, transcriptional activator for dmlA